MLNKKHVLAVAAASVMAFGATSFSAASAMPQSAGARAAKTHGMTQVHYKRHRTHLRSEQSRNWGGPFGAATVPGAVVGGALATTGAIVGGTLATTGAIVGGTTGYPYGPYAGGYAYAPQGYGAYAYAPGGYVSRDIGNGYYNGVTAPASQDSCAGDGGYGRLDYAIGC
jgi:hypothetical protein